MDYHDINHILQALRDSQAEFHAVTKGLSEEQAHAKPAGDRWSVLDCVEHIAIVEGRVLDRLENPIMSPAPPADRAREDKMLADLVNRATRFQAPEGSRPTGRYATLAEALAEFDAARARTIAFAEKHGNGIYSISSVHPVFGPVNGGDTLCLAAAHSLRHADQIRDVRAELGV